MDQSGVAIEGERISAYRNHQNLSQQELGAKIGASVNTIQRWEKSGCSSSGDAPRKLSELLARWEEEQNRLEEWVEHEKILNEIVELMPPGSTGLSTILAFDDQWFERAAKWFEKASPEVMSAFMHNLDSSLTQRQRSIVAFFTKYQLQAAFNANVRLRTIIGGELETERELSKMMHAAIDDLRAFREQAEQVKSLRNEAAQELSDAIRLRREALQAYESAQLEIERFWKRRVADLEGRLEEMEKRLTEKQ